MINTSYVFWMANSILICAALHGGLTARLKHRGVLTVLTCLLATALGIVFARLAYCLIQIDYVMYDGFWETMKSDNLAYTSYYGSMAGAILGALLAAVITGNRPVRALNVWAPAGALMAAQARFAEYFLGTLRAGNYLEDAKVCFFPLAVENEWGEWYLAVFMLAGIVYLAVFFFSLFIFRKQRFARTLFYLCLTQIMLESLRNQSLIWSEFVRAEQLLCMVAAEGVLILLGVQLIKKGLPFARAFVPAFAGLFCAGVFVAVEFTVQGKILPDMPGSVYLGYGVMLLGLMLLAVLEGLWRRKLNRKA